jgi:hypothetical protein
MASEIETCAAAFFRASGKDVVTADEFVMDASLKLKWMPPSKAKNLLTLLESEGAVSCRNSYVRLSPELGDVEVPLMYKPSAELVARLSKPIEAAKPAPAQAGTTSGTEKKPAAAQKPAREEKDAFHMLMEAAEKAGIPRKDFIQSSNRIQKSLGIDIGAAALIALRDGGADIAPYAAEVYGMVRDS